MSEENQTETPVPVPEVLKYWYITYVAVPTPSQRKKLQKSIIHDATAIKHPSPEFLPGEATLGLKFVNRYESLVIQDWKEISKNQYDNFISLVFNQDPNAVANADQEEKFEARLHAVPVEDEAKEEV
jgi:hypothetical protein